MHQPDERLWCASAAGVQNPAHHRPQWVQRCTDQSLIHGRPRRVGTPRPTAHSKAPHQEEERPQGRPQGRPRGRIQDDQRKETQGVHEEEERPQGRPQGRRQGTIGDDQIK